MKIGGKKEGKSGKPVKRIEILLMELQTNDREEVKRDKGQQQKRREAEHHT